MSERTPGDDGWYPWGSGTDDSDPRTGPREEPTWASPAGSAGGAEHPQPRVSEGVTRPYQPISGSWAQPSSPGYPSGPTGTSPAASSPPSATRRGPGWGALVGATVAVGLLAGTTGGIVGGFLSDRDGGRSAGPNLAAPSPGAGATTRAEGTIANIAATALPSVVTLRIAGDGGDATGSGWVYDDAGHVVTNNHVVAGAGRRGEVTVVLSSGKQIKGTVVGTDESYDLAVVELEDKGLAALPVGRSADVVVGDQVIAVGAPLGLDSTVTTGIVSALDRPVTPGARNDQAFINAIQTDAAINPGNSGGPLLDMQGRVIGVNTAIAQVPGSSLGGQSGNIGVGFAIPSDQVLTTVQQLIEKGTAEHPIIGVFLDSTYDGEGVRIADTGPDGQPAVNPGGPADEAGLRAGDVIVAFEGTPVTEDGELIVKIRARRVGETVNLTVRRDGRDRDVRMVLAGAE